MDSDFQIELLERAFLLQEKRVWSLETMLKIERGQILTELSEDERQCFLESLSSNVRIAKECLNDVARNSGYESGVAKIFDPSFNLGIPASSMTATVARQIEQLDAAEERKGIKHFKAMCRELAVFHEPYFEDVEAKIRQDIELHSLFRDMSPGKTEGLSVKGPHESQKRPESGSLKNPLNDSHCADECDPQDQPNTSSVTPQPDADSP